MGYFGSKAASGAYQAVIAAMPPHDTYIEAFLGSGVVMRAKPPAARQIGVELDTRAWASFYNLLGARDYAEPDARRGNRSIYPLADALADLRFDGVRMDAVAFLRDFDYISAGRSLIYADPPYVLATRSSAKRYRHDFTDLNHRLLIGVLRQVPAAVILSGYPSALYDELVGDWRQISFQVMTRGGPRTECLWLNFPAGEVAWSSFAGANFTDRQRIKRKAARWAAHYRRLPAGERLAVLAALLGEHGEDPA